MDKIESIELIYRNPEVRRGMPCIVGTTIRVMDVVINMTYNDRSPEEMAKDYDMPLAKVHAALAYYYGHREEIDADIRADIKRSDELVAEGFAKPLDSIFPLKLSVEQLDELLDMLASKSASAPDTAPLTSAMKRQLIREFVAAKADMQLV